MPISRNDANKLGDDVIAQARTLSPTPTSILQTRERAYFVQAINLPILAASAASWMVTNEGLGPISAIALGFVIGVSTHYLVDWARRRQLRGERVGTK